MTFFLSYREEHSRAGGVYILHRRAQYLNGLYDVSGVKIELIQYIEEVLH
jgi:hypothetical protein